MTTAVATELKARVQRSDFLRVLKHIASLVPTNSIPILRSVRIEAFEAGFLTLTGTDMGTMVRVQVPADVQAAGVILVPAKELQAMLTFVQVGELEMDQKGYNLEVTAGNDQFELQGFIDKGYPTPFEGETTPLFTIGRSDLNDMVSSIGHCAGVDESKPWLKCLELKFADGLMQVTATNGVAIATWDKPANVVTDGRILVEPYALRMVGALANPGEQVAVSINEHSVLFEGHDFTVWYRKNDWQYPDVRRLIPVEYPVTATVDRQSLLGATRLAMIKGKFVSVTKGGEMGLTVNQNEMRVQFGRPEVSNFVRRLPATTTGSLELVGFNSALLARPLENLRGQEVRIEFNGPKAPARLVCDDQPHIAYVVLPLITF